ncbi:MAG: 16S rRNA (cytosine(1402)-N(4))-methyltransferase RsmH [Candidatus Krumholzibacteria bacterium]|nr:16S rRNA (cytosine(1402)-N(4))-methyltransferase RsmH [Candidatus Krumholzibacteria bacterium]
MSHKPVMVQETLTYLLHDNSQSILDATVGCGGHTMAILKADPSVRVLGIDRDAQALRDAQRMLKAFATRIRLVETNFVDVGKVLSEWGRVDGILADLGVSSLQLDTSSRGFSYSKDGPLDMKMSPEGRTARMLLQETQHSDLAQILRQYGEVSGATRIARSIRRAVERNNMRTTRDLAIAIDSALPGVATPALLSKVFQAVRIAVNDELRNITEFLERVFTYVNQNARIVIISYHSLEDRLIKDFFRRESKDCLCPTAVPVCTCDHSARLEVLTRRVVKPSVEEITRNTRARSARLRAARVLG